MSLVVARALLQRVISDPVNGLQSRINDILASIDQRGDFDAGSQKLNTFVVIHEKAAGLLICVSGVIYFADTRMKTSDNSFSGFPGCWNMIVLVLFAIDMGGWAAMFLLIAIAISQFFALKFIHPVRTERWRAVSLPIMFAWAGFATWLAWLNFDGPMIAQVGLAITSLYLLLVGIVQQLVPAQN